MKNYIVLFFIIYNMIIPCVLIVVGFVCLIYGANWLVDGASAFAKKLNVSDLTIGLTVVAFGTSAPELIVNIIGSIQGHADIVLGNVIGSNNLNLYIVLGISGVIMPVAVQKSTAWKEIPMSLFATLILFFLINDFTFSSHTQLSRIEGGILLLLFAAFLYYVFSQMKQNGNDETEGTSMSNLKIWGYIVGGLAGLVIGGQFVVTNSVTLAEFFGVSQKIIGLTIVAAGTSLPELVTSVVAATKKNSDIAIGNIIGSNVFNIVLILGVSSLIHPITYNPKFNIDFYILIAGTIFLLLAMLVTKKRKIGRVESAILIVFYILYVLYLISNEL